MTTKAQTILTISTTVYLLTVLFTDLSLTGYWTDIIFSILLVSTSLFIVFKRKTERPWLTSTLRTLTVMSSIVVFGSLGLNLINPFAWDTFKMQSFIYQNVDGRLFNAYFKPVGAYAGGEGSFWITESPKYFPLIEMEKFYDGAVLWDFRVTEWEGETVDQNEVIKSFVMDEIIEKENKR